MKQSQESQQLEYELWLVLLGAAIADQQVAEQLSRHVSLPCAPSLTAIFSSQFHPGPAKKWIEQHGVALTATGPWWLPILERLQEASRQRLCHRMGQTLASPGQHHSPQHFHELLTRYQHQLGELLAHGHHRPEDPPQPGSNRESPA